VKFSAIKMDCTDHCKEFKWR